ncbi:MAG: hypothetical protein AB7O86_14025 [Porticoccaceae bacterium]
MTITADKQVEFDGLLLADRYEIRQIVGLAGMPPVRTSDLTIAGRHGERGGFDYLAGRTVTLDIDVYAWSSAEFADAVAELREVFQPRESGAGVLAFQLPGIAGGQTARLNCRPRRMALPLEPTYWADFATCSVELFAPDPVLYSDTAYEQTTTLPSAGGGLEFDVEFDAVFGAVSTGGTIFADNQGTWPADVVIRIDGPAVNPRVENLTTGQTIALSYNLGSGEYLLIDTQQRTVLLNGTASRYSALTDASTWWRLAPGVNDVTFRATTSTAATMTLSWRSAWL